MKKINWSPNMMTFVGALMLALVASLAFVALVKGEGGGAFAFITISIIGTGLFTGGVLLNHDNRLVEHEHTNRDAGQVISLSQKP
ncbi:MAG TPA: hypothetical protein VN754_13150 [Candidatus Binataceae bacterium]|nr:hypothetical protein [Candidatus Binataceae bacterium]